MTQFKAFLGRFKALVALFLLSTVQCFAAPVAKTLLPGGGTLVLHDTPCASEKALARIQDQFKGLFMHGEFTYLDGKTIVACWAPYQGKIVISDEEGDGGIMESDDFTKIDGSPPKRLDNGKTI